MDAEHNDHEITRGWFLSNWYATHRWACSMRLALMALVLVLERIAR